MTNIDQGQALTNPGGVTGDQMKKIWATARELGWNYDELHRWVHSAGGPASLKALTRRDAMRLIDRMDGLLARGQARAYREAGMGVDETGKMVEYATAAQLAKLRATAYRLNWGDAWLENVASRTTGRRISKLANLRFREAQKLIPVVEGLVQKREKELQAKRGLFGEGQGAGDEGRGKDEAGEAKGQEAKVKSQSEGA